MALAVFGLTGCSTTRTIGPPPDENAPGVSVSVGKIIMIDPEDKVINETLRANPPALRDSALRDSAMLGGLSATSSASGTLGIIALDILSSGSRPYKILLYKEDNGLVNIAPARKTHKHQVGDTIKVIRRGERYYWIFNLTRDEITGKSR